MKFAVNELNCTYVGAVLSGHSGLCIICAWRCAGGMVLKSVDLVGDVSVGSQLPSSGCYLLFRRFKWYVFCIVTTFVGHRNSLNTVDWIPSSRRLSHPASIWTQLTPVLLGQRLSGSCIFKLWLQENSFKIEKNRRRISAVFTDDNHGQYKELLLNFYS